MQPQDSQAEFGFLTKLVSVESSGQGSLCAGSRPATATKVHRKVPGLRIAAGNQAPSLAPRTEFRST